MPGALILPLSRKGCEAQGPIPATNFRKRLMAIPTLSGATASSPVCGCTADGVPVVDYTAPRVSGLHVSSGLGIGRYPQSGSFGREHEGASGLRCARAPLSQWSASLAGHDVRF